MKQSKYNYIEGPVTLTEVILESGKHFYIFGDHHFKRRGCLGYDDYINISDLIEDSINTSDKFIDVFLEIDFITDNTIEEVKQKYIDPNTDYITEIYHRFKDCFNKKDCRFQNARFHYSDIRSIGIFAEYMSFVQNIQGLVDLFNAGLIDRNKFNEVFKILLSEGIDIVKRIPRKPEDLYLISKVNKQLYNINDKDISTKIYDYFNAQITEKLILAQIVWKTYDINSSYEEIHPGINLYVDVFSILMDFYIVGRSFRNFNNESSPNNIIIYAGEIHTDNIQKFIYDNFTVTLIEKSISPGKTSRSQCLPINKFKTPLFS